ncbi:MAG: ABC transporter substrate-binding protein [Litoreibacter sp.]
MTYNNFTRRTALTLGVGAMAASVLPAHALTPSEAEAHVNNAVSAINKIIASERSNAVMIRDFEQIFSQFADVNRIALTTLGTARRSASKAEINAYVKAFRSYFTRKYGKRFNEFLGGKIVVNGSRNSKNFIEVKSTAKLRGSAPFAVDWRISDKSGKTRIFDIIIEGVSALSSERAEIGAMLDKRGGDVGKVTADLHNRSS